MSNATAEKIGWRQRLTRETKVYLFNFLYLAVVLGAFNWYQRLILAEHNIQYLEYGIALIEAAVLAKVVMIGDLLRIGRRVKGRPLIVPTVYRAITFSIWVGVFKFLEHMVRGILRGEGLAGGIDELMSHSPYEMLAMSLVVVCAFVPFFAFKELAQALGEGKMFELFMRRAGDK